MSELREKSLSSQLVFQGKILRLRVDQIELSDGRQSEREVVEHPGAVGIIALDDAGKLILVRQYRYPVGDVLLEIPAGKVDAGEKPLLCAKRELREETGWEAENWQEISNFFSSPGFTNEKLYLYKANVSNYCGPENDEDENIEVEVLDLDGALEMIKLGKIKDAKSIIGIMTLRLFYM